MDKLEFDTDIITERAHRAKVKKANMARRIHYVSFPRILKYY